MKPLIVFEDVSFQYQAGNQAVIPAIRNVSLQVNEGEWVAIVGANGSGKSTFARLASALLLPVSGHVQVAGMDTRRSDHQARIHATAGMVFQFPEDQIVSTTVEEDVAFGPENLALPPDEIRSRVEEALREVGMWEARLRPPHLLSAGQIQRVALAGVLAMNPKCIVFDEATTMLDPAGRRSLLAAVRRLHQQGTTILYITHFMDEAVQAGRVIVFERGQIALDGSPGEVFADAPRLASLGLDLPPAAHAAAILRTMIPQFPQGLLKMDDLCQALPGYPASAGLQLTGLSGRPAESVAEPLIQVEALGYVYMRGTPLQQRALEGVNLRVPAGQAHGLVGRTGSGKSTLMQHLNALLRPQEGRVRVGQFLLNDPLVDRRDVIRLVGLVFQNPEAQFFEHYTGDEIVFGPRQLQVGKDGKTTLAERVRWAMEQVGLDFAGYKDRPLYTLSGGERRKVALASTLAIKPSILLLDEPTAGLDPRSRHDLLIRLQQMREQGMTIVLSSHQMEDMASLAQDLTVFDQGRNVLTGSTADLFARPEILERHGIEAPAAARAAAALRAKGWPVPVPVLTLEELSMYAAQVRSMGKGL